MTKFLTFLLMLFATVAYAERAPIARIQVPERGSTSYGSGTCVASTDTRSLVLTNNHVVVDRAENIRVHFPAYVKTAKVVKVDPVFDLAALVIEEGDLPVMRISKVRPVRDVAITIAGYGKGKYREATGEVRTFAYPGVSNLADWMIVTIPARSGDSGGPMIYANGLLAGVLWGTNDNEVYGSHCIRVRIFIKSIDKYPKLKLEALK